MTIAPGTACFPSWRAAGGRRRRKNAAQACDRAWGWGPHASFADDEPEQRFSGLRRGFSARMRFLHRWYMNNRLAAVGGERRRRERIERLLAALIAPVIQVRLAAWVAAVH